MRRRGRAVNLAAVMHPPSCRLGLILPPSAPGGVPVLAAWQARCLAALRAEGALPPCRLDGAATPDPLGPDPGAAPGDPRAPRPWPEATAPPAAPDGAAVDLLLALAPPPPGLAPPRLGLWWLELGRPPGAAGLLAARLLCRGADGAVRRLEEGVVRQEAHRPEAALRRLLAAAALWPARRLRALALQGGRALAGAPAGPPLDPPPAPPGRGARLAALARRLVEACFEDRWRVAVSARPIASFLEGPDPAPFWLPPAGGRDFHADPFGRSGPDGLEILVETFDAGRGRGRIDRLHLEGPQGARAGPVPAGRDLLPRPCHLSYPFLIEQAGEVLCVPESHEERRVVLWRAESFPDRWVVDSVLIEGVAALDSTLFRHQGRWWLLCTDHDLGGDEALLGFFAPDLRGPWTPHPLNPLKQDPRSARPGGTPFAHGGALWRPAQDCADIYGGALVINRVDHLSPTGFAETPVVRLAPDPAGPCPHGLHTLSAVAGPSGDGLTLLDGKRRHFVPWRPLEILAGRWRRRG